MILNRLNSLVMLFALLVSPLAYGQALKDSDKSETIEKLGELLVRNYVDEKLGEAMAEKLQRLEKEGTFTSIGAVVPFAQRLTSELQDLCKDKHLRVRASGAAGSMPQPIGQQPFGECKWLNDSIGYLSIVEFAGKSFAQPAIDKCMRDLSSAKRIIIDVRNCRGGSPETVSYLCSYFLPPNKLLNSIYNRAMDNTREFFTEKPAEKPLREVPVTVLTSPRTFSAGEEFAYDMKVWKRADLVGEVTGGAANPGGVFKITNQFSVFIPTGRVTNPVTKSNWEGKGVTPDFTVMESEALEFVLSGKNQK